MVVTSSGFLFQVLLLEFPLETFVPVVLRWEVSPSERSERLWQGLPPVWLGEDAMFHLLESPLSVLATAALV